jgi:hypothetical protein
MSPLDSEAASDYRWHLTEERSAVLVINLSAVQTLISSEDKGLWLILVDYVCVLGPQTE